MSYLRYILAIFLLFSTPLQFAESSGTLVFLGASGNSTLSSITFITSSIITTGTSSGSTTPATNTTGANLIVVAISFNNGSSPTVSDSKSNTWTALTSQNGGTGNCTRLYYCFSPTVGTGHTFQVAGASTFSAIAAMAFSGALSFDQQSGPGTVSGNNLTPGAIMPTNDNSLLVTCVNHNSTSAETINSGFSAISFPQVNGVTYQLGMAYLIQGAKASINPTWTSGSAGTTPVAAMSSFNPAVNGTQLTFRGSP